MSLLDDLARQYGTPLYVYRLDAVRRAVAGLSDALPDGVGIYYSAKANPHPAFIAAVAALDLGIEVSSVGEVDAVIRAEVAPDRCLYTGPAKTAAEIVAAVRAGVRLYSVESPADRARLAAAADVPVEYLVRLNGTDAPGAAGLRMTGTASQFGVDADTVGHGSDLFRACGEARPVGMHVFSATNVRDEDALLNELVSNLATATATARRTGFEPTILDLGGGFGAPFAAPGVRPSYPALKRRLAEALEAMWPGWRDGQPRIVVESGRHVSAEAGTLLTTVIDRKVSGGRTYILCDAGVNALGGMSGIGRLLAPAAQPDGQSVAAATVVLAGPLCTPLDVLSRTARVDDAAIGDVLAIPNVGAYGLTASLVAFLGRPMPVEVLLDGDDVVGARRLGLREIAVPEYAGDARP